MSEIEEFALNVLLLVGFYVGLVVWIKARNIWIGAICVTISMICFKLLVGRA